MTHKNLGKNPPPKLTKPKQKNVASIPSNTVAPPEDKAAMNNTFSSEFGYNFQQDSSDPIPRRTSYLAQLEKANNPNVGPGSYDPV